MEEGNGEGRRGRKEGHEEGERGGEGVSYFAAFPLPLTFAPLCYRLQPTFTSAPT